MPLIVVDPGHGGTDPGTVGNGLQEKDIALDAAMKLTNALERCGIQVIMTRTTDMLPSPNGTISQDLTKRAMIANQNHADLFISWHVDSASDSLAHGDAVWIYPSTSGTSTEDIARMIATAISNATGQQDRGVYYADFAVLRETNMQAVLIESGFITNPDEAALLANQSFRSKQAEATAMAVCDFYQLPYVAPSNSKPSTGDVTDQSSWPSWAQKDITTVLQWGLMNGYPDGTFRPEAPVTRAELAVVLVRFEKFIRMGGVQ